MQNHRKLSARPRRQMCLMLFGAVSLMVAGAAAAQTDGKPALPPPDRALPQPADNAAPVDAAAATPPDASAPDSNDASSATPAVALDSVTSASPQVQHPPQGFTVGAGLRASTLGAGIELATPVTHNTNVRIGYNGLFDISHHFSKDDIDYNAKLKLSSFDALFDYFPFGGIFHLSAGVSYGDRIKADAKAMAAAGSTFKLNDTLYTSSDNDPAHGNARIDFSKLAPMVTLGWGNLVPRGGHFSFSFEVGAIFQGGARSDLHLQGSACDGGAVACPVGTINLATDPTVQTNIQAEEHKLDHELHSFKIFPVLALGFGYRL